jgi:preprotein translocase subunit YajC
MFSGSGQSAASPLVTIAPFVLIFVVFYLLVIRPQRKQQLQRERMIAALKKGDRVVTTGGIHATVAAVEDDTLILKVAENTKIRVARSAIAGLVGSEGAAAGS